jgi:hypothetical protein
MGTPNPNRQPAPVVQSRRHGTLLAPSLRIAAVYLTAFALAALSAGSATAEPRCHNDGTAGDDGGLCITHTLTLKLGPRLDGFNDCIDSYAPNSPALLTCCLAETLACTQDCDNGAPEDLDECNQWCAEVGVACGVGDKGGPEADPEPGYHEDPKALFQPGGTGSFPLDWCLSWGADCGAPPAHQFCQFKEGPGWVAQRFQKEHDVPPTKLIGSGEICDIADCDSFEYIQCTDTRVTTQDPMWKGYRLDFCRFNGLNHPGSCGQPSADAYCRNTQGDGYYAMDWTKADNVGPTRIIANNQICSGSWCDGFSEIMCAYDPLMSSIPDDFDSDGREDLYDNCPGNPNPLQENVDGDLLGDVCDPHPLEPEHCSDGLDNDGDGVVDQADPGCSWHSDSSEQSLALPCDDGVDNDGDGHVDYPDDPSCTSLEDVDEVGSTQCDDGLDNDGDGHFDLDDPDCDSPEDDDESAPVGKTKIRCGLGFEQIVLLPALMALRRRRSA